MKVTKPFCIDSDLLEELKKVNASDLVNSLIREHIEGISSMDLKKLKATLSKKREEKAILLKEIRVISSKIREIEVKEAKILRISKKYPDYVFKVIEGSSSLMNFYSSFKTDERLKRFNWLELKKLYYELKGGNK